MLHPNTEPHRGAECGGQTKAVSPMRSMCEAYDATHAFVRRVIELAEKLVGPVAEESNSTAEVQPSAGVLPAIGLAAVQTRRLISQGHEALNRIEAQLP